MSRRSKNLCKYVIPTVLSCVSYFLFTIIDGIFVGHGVGREMHEDPPVPNYGRPGRGPLLKPGMTFAIEPMINLGSPEVEILDDGWTVVTRDGQPSAHFEHTVAVLEDGVDILTLP